MLSIGLQGCARPQTDARPAPVAVAVRVEDTPPADLIACPVDPEGFPLDAEATMPPPVRAAAIRLAQSYAAIKSQLVRLIAWEQPGSCAPAAPAAP